MDEAVMRERVGEARVGRLATIRADGSPRLVPCCFASRSDRVYTAVDDVKAKSTLRLGRLADVAADPRASLLVDHYDDDWSQLWWVRLDAVAMVLAPEDEGHDVAVASLMAKYDQYRRRPPPGAVIALEVMTWRAWP